MSDGDGGATRAAQSREVGPTDEDLYATVIRVGAVIVLVQCLVGLVAARVAVGAALAVLLFAGAGAALTLAASLAGGRGG
ncbi:hypothetical protein RYH80_07805 [Halobaculum sp. MBLA0147]|uniref:hypothetical protein n=1 Tax=Halobaculum sp. MBLA0147 TaxID=3079934 RepID=UPI003523904B